MKSGSYYPDLTGLKLEKITAFCPDVIVRAGIGYSGTTSMFITSNTINSSTYNEIITQHYLPYHQNRFYCHVSAAARTFMDENSVNLLDWPPRSPNCNPLENVWGILVYRLYGDSNCYSN